MHKAKSIFSSVIIAFLLTLSVSGSVYGAVWEFGSSGTGNNHFTPRGFLVDTDKGQHWLSSGYNNSGENIYYSGVKNGVDYLDAKKSDGSNYTFYAMSHRNNTPGKEYLAVYKDGTRIDLGSYTGTPGRGDKVDPSGNGTCYVIPIENFELEFGTMYEFIFLQGMKANNGVTMVLAPGTVSGKYTGYIKMNGNDYTSEEEEIYNENRNREYMFVESYTKDDRTGEYDVNRIHMRFSVQTYADLSRWKAASEAARQFMDSVKESDYQNGKYKRANIKDLANLLSSLDKRAENTVKKQLKATANRSIDDMIEELNASVKRAKTDKPTSSDISKLTEKIREAVALYNKVRGNIGTEKGQYGVLEVEDLEDEIARGKGMDKYTEQSEINNQVTALTEAMNAVYDSLVEKARKIYYDRATGIYVIVPADALSESATLSVTRVGKSESEFTDMKKKLPAKKQKAELYDIRFYLDEKRIYPLSDVEVQMPIVDTILSNTSAVYKYNGKKLTELKSIKSNGMQIFKSDLKNSLVMAGLEISAEAQMEKNRTKSEEKSATVLGSTSGNRSHRNENVLAATKKKKEVYKDPLERLVPRSENLSSFDADVKLKSNPMFLIVFAVILAVLAALLGINAMRRSRHEAKM